jgi:hypothetical protein
MLDTLASVKEGKHPVNRSTAIDRAQKLLEQIKGPFAGSLTEFSRNPEELYQMRKKIGECIVTLL